MKTVLTFIFVFCVIVIVHELGHFIFAKLSGILVREFSIGMGPKLYSHRGKDGTTYTLRLLPIGGYVRMAGAGEEEAELHPGQPLSVELDADNVVVRINTSSKVQFPNSIPLELLDVDLEDDGKGGKKKKSKSKTKSKTSFLDKLPKFKKGDK